jgi:hypothetical protein
MRKQRETPENWNTYYIIDRHMVQVAPNEVHTTIVVCFYVGFLILYTFDVWFAIPPVLFRGIAITELSFLPPVFAFANAAGVNGRINRVVNTTNVIIYLFFTLGGVCLLPSNKISSAIVRHFSICLKF